MTWERKEYLLKRYHATILARCVMAGHPHMYVHIPRYSERSIYPHFAHDKGLAYSAYESPRGLRFFANVAPESYGSRTSTFWRERKQMTGWYTEDSGDCYTDGTGLCWGVVYQLTAAKRGRARYVAGYQMGGTDSGPVLDLTRVFTMENHNGFNNATKGEDDIDDAAFEAAKWADQLANRAAEEEREYQRQYAEDMECEA